MKDSNISQTEHEKNLFKEFKNDIRRECDQALRYWQQIRKRYVYQDVQYSAQDVFDWFMHSPFEEVKAISQDLGIDWKTIGNDLRRMVDFLEGFESEQTLFSKIKEPFIGDSEIYAKRRVIEDIDQCDFYHTIDLPGHGTIEGNWDLRNGIEDYLGSVNFNGKRVLDIGTANGILCFETERQGAEVVAFDLSKDYRWDLVPYTRFKDSDYIYRAHTNHIDKLNNAFWFCHRCLNSNAKVVYGNVYDIPEQIGKVDVVIYGAILLHLRDPFLALQSGTKLTQGTVIVTEVFRSQTFKSKKSVDQDLKEPYLKFLPDPETLEPTDTWWDLRPEVVVRMLKVLGFADITVTYHSQIFKGEEAQLYTVVGRQAS